MRIWLDPAKLNSFQLTPGDVADAIREQNVQVSSGRQYPPVLRRRIP